MTVREILHAPASAVTRSPPISPSTPRLNEIVKGRRAVTPDTALRLARVLGMPADFWLGLQSDWHLWHALHSDSAAEIERLSPLGKTGASTGD